MREYIFYVILFFIPIGGFMVYFLRRDGLQGKYINIILLVSLFIILSFPISMERLGGPISITIYMLLLAVMAGYLVKARVGSLSVITVPGNNTEEPFEPIVAENKHDDLASSNEGIENSGPAKTLKGDNDPHLVEESKTGAQAGVAVEVDNSTRLTQETDGGTTGPITEADEQAERKEGLEAVEETIKVAAENQEVGVDSSERESLFQVVTFSNQEAEECLAETAATTAELLLEQSPNQEVIPPTPDALDDSVPAVVGGEPNYQEDESNQLGGYDEPVIAPGEIAGETESGDEQFLVQDVAGEQIMSLVDYAFSCRENNIEEATKHFEEAWNLTADYELKYLLTLELVGIYKDNGWYNQAMSLLVSFIALPGLKSDIINEINRQIDYISLLVAEMNRLGISGLPVSRIPRWVRLKVDAAMNPPEYR